MAKTDLPADTVMKEALDLFEESVEGSEYNREEYYEDFQFARLEEQWPDAIKKQRLQEGRPALVINKLPSYIRSVVNESRQNKPAIRVAPVDNGADEETAEVIGGLIRSIERNSHADVAYDTAIDHSVTGGFGFFRIAIDYAHDETFDMECLIKRIPNAMMVHWDTSSTEFDASDWEYAFISDMMKEEKFHEQYPNAARVSFDGDSRNDASDQWINDDDIRLAEYFRREQKLRTLIQFAVVNPETGQTDLQAVREEDLPSMAARFFEAGGITPDGGSDKELAQAFVQAAGMEERRRRAVEYHCVKRRLISGVEVLEEDEWPGSTIPICPVWGDEVFLDGRRHFRSLIRSAKDSQQMYNFWRTAETELVALAPKAPWIGPKGFVPKGHETKWTSANTRSHAYLEYDPEVGPPTRQAFAGVPAGALREGLSANDDMKSIMGIFDSSIGAQSNETSGKAILARERQGDVSNFHFIDNLSRAIGYCGRCLVEIIPSVYSVRSSIRILGEDEAFNVIHLTQQGGGARHEGVDGQPELYNLSVGQYDVDVKTGPSFSTQREETRETLIEIMRQVPDAAAFLGDVLLDHMDFVGADKVAKRLKHLLPEPIQKMESDEITGDDNPEAAQAQQELQAYKVQVDQAQKAVMEEIEKIKAENEALKQSHQAEAARIQMDGAAKAKELDLKEREVALKEAEANNAAPEPSYQEKWDYDRVIAGDKMAHESVEADKDRQTDLAKVIIGKVEEGDGGEVVEDAATTALAQAAALMAAPKRLIRDERGVVIGVETVTND